MALEGFMGGTGRAFRSERKGYGSGFREPANLSGEDGVNAEERGVRVEGLNRHEDVPMGG